MSWTNELYNVYEKNWGGPYSNDPLLLPVAHSTANAQIEVMIDEDGNFIKAERVNKDQAVTVIPVTMDSIAKSGSGAIPHPFADNLVYIAGDYGKYFGGKRADNEKFFSAYIEQLRKWADSEYSHKAVKAVLKYIEKKSVMHDLIVHGVLIVDDSGMLKDKESIQGISQEKAFVRFIISYIDKHCESRTWKDSTLYDSFISYNASLEQNVQLCYAEGKVLPVTYKHPNKIRNAGDAGKLISSNDESGFTYRGRFCDKEEAISVSFDFSQKMHNALKWLIERQGVSVKKEGKAKKENSIGGSVTIIVWESAMRELPTILDSADEFEDEKEECLYADTYPLYKKRLEKSIFGFKEKLCLDKASKAMVMILDSATKGRISIGFYSELQSSEFLDNLQKWHEDTAWFVYNDKQKEYVFNSFSLKNIIDCAFGTEQGKSISCNTELRSEYVCRLVPCVVEGRGIPKDIVRNLVNRASSPLKYSSFYNWRNVLATACGMIRKEKIDNKEECSMALDINNHDRSYLYGRLLAVADIAELKTYDQKEKCTTNAKRYFSAFSSRPCSTWEIIRKQLSPYLEKLDKSNGSVYTDNYYTNLIHSITSMFTLKDFAENSKLDPIYLHAYSCQVKEMGCKCKTTGENMLDDNCNDRSYLYGRLFAVADVAEMRTYDHGISRTTNAKRLLSAFANRPCSTWNVIRNQISPYLERLDKRNDSGFADNYYSNLINNITEQFDAEDFADNSPLDPIWLHAYSCQLGKIYGGNNNNNMEE